MFKQIKEFFMGKPVAAVEAPYKIEAPVTMAVIAEDSKNIIVLPVKKTRKPRTPKVEQAPKAVVKAKAPVKAKVVVKAKVSAKSVAKKQPSSMIAATKAKSKKV